MSIGSVLLYPLALLKTAVSQVVNPLVPVLKSLASTSRLETEALATNLVIPAEKRIGSPVNLQAKALKHPQVATVKPSKQRLMEMIVLELLLSPGTAIRDTSNAEHAIVAMLKLSFPGAEKAVHSAVLRGKSAGILVSTPSGNVTSKQIFLSAPIPPQEIEAMIKRYPGVANGRSWPHRKNQG